MIKLAIERVGPARAGPESKPSAGTHRDALRSAPIPSLVAAALTHLAQLRPVVTARASRLAERSTLATRAILE